MIQFNPINSKMIQNPVLKLNSSIHRCFQRLARRARSVTASALSVLAAALKSNNFSIALALVLYAVLLSEILSDVNTLCLNESARTRSCGCGCGVRCRASTSRAMTSCSFSAAVSAHASANSYCSCRWESETAAAFSLAFILIPYA